MTANVDPKTGIRYGVVSLNNLADWVFDEFFLNGVSETYEAAKKEHFGDKEPDDNELEEFNDNFDCDEEEYSLETDGMKLLLNFLGGAPLVWVIESPHRAFCAECSPCCPNAGNLDEKREGGVETYDLPKDWYYTEDEDDSSETC